MKTAIKQQIANEAKAYMDEHKMTMAEFSRRSNVGEAHLSHIFKPNSDFTIPTGTGSSKIADRYFQTIAEYIGLKLTKTYWELKPTKQLTMSLAVLKDGKEYGETNIIIGETGSGKTQSLKVFARKNPTDTFVITVGSTDNLADLIDKIIDKLKITTGKTKSKKLRDISKKLKNMQADGYKPQIIFDEAEYMKQPALCSIKELYDHLHQHCSIVLVGTDQLIENIDRLRKRNKPGIPQFYRRVKFGIRQLPAVDRSFTLFTEDLDEEVVKFLRKICDNYGELHDVLVPVRRESERTGEPITEEFIRKVLNLDYLAA